MWEEEYLQNRMKRLVQHHFSEISVIQFSTMHLSGHHLHYIKCNMYFLWTFVYKYPFAVWNLCLLIFYEFCMSDALLHFFSCGHCPIFPYAILCESHLQILQKCGYKGQWLIRTLGGMKHRYTERRVGRANKQRHACFSLPVTHFFVTEEFSNEEES